MNRATGVTIASNRLDTGYIRVCGEVVERVDLSDPHDNTINGLSDAFSDDRARRVLFLLLVWQYSYRLHRFDA